ncbi:hypothetical protein [Bacillus horti]|uniref:DUF4052 domain-containing protein n=1 Tax=Caldalkalibacillus horti TaxID=77523 RepID=A0ABT9VZ40_9BACI|nr:hypothetical protein [Bacillus horti]MDQ0166242.1 hypothetical protein [Bacillus horti]
MSSFQGTLRLIYEDSRWFIGKLLFLYITLPLAVAQLTIGILFDLTDATAVIVGPAFFFIPFYAAVGYKGILPIAVSLGSTRTQFLKAFYGVALVATTAFMIVLNLLQLIIITLYDSGISSMKPFHLGVLFVSEYNFISYLWIDLMVGFFMFGAMFLIYTIIYLVGVSKSLMILMGIFIAGLFAYYSGSLQAPLDWIVSLNISAMTYLTLLGGIGLAALVVAYPIMKNASLQPKAKKE